MDLFSSSDLISIEALTGIFFRLKQQWERGNLMQFFEICMWLDNYMTNIGQPSLCDLEHLRVSSGPGTKRSGWPG